VVYPRARSNNRAKLALRCLVPCGVASRPRLTRCRGRRWWLSQIGLGIGS